MIFDRKCGVIIMLCGLVENGKVNVMTIYLMTTIVAYLWNYTCRKYATSTGHRLAWLGLENMVFTYWQRRQRMDLSCAHS